MFGREVKIGDVEIFICCTPQTPLSEVLRDAATEMRRREEKARQSDPAYIAYRRALTSVQ